MNSSVDNLLPAGIRIALCLGLALLCHIIFYQTARFELTASIIDPQDKTVTVVQLRPSDLTQQSGVVQASNEVSSQAAERIDTVGSSQHLISELAHKQKSHTKQTTDTVSKRPKIRPSNQQTLKSSQQQRLSKAFSSNSQEHSSTSRYRQESSRQAEPLSPYQLKLIQHLLRAELYDTFHRHLKALQQSSINYRLSIKLDASGTINKAEVITSTGIATLDKHALRAAYNASPYPMPPPKDRLKDFVYEIPVSYKALR